MNQTMQMREHFFSVLKQSTTVQFNKERMKKTDWIAEILLGLAVLMFLGREVCSFAVLDNQCYKNEGLFSYFLHQKPNQCSVMNLKICQEPMKPVKLTYNSSDINRMLDPMSLEALTFSYLSAFYSSGWQPLSYPGQFTFCQQKPSSSSSSFFLINKQRIH